MIDLCISLSGPCVGYLLPIALQSLHRFESIPNSAIHLVDEDCTPAVKAYLDTLKSRGYNTYGHIPPARPKPYDAPHLGDAMEVERDWVWKNIENQHWMVKNCGSSDWVFIMHFDVEFKTPWLSRLISTITPSVGQVGAHNCGLVGYRRSALSQSHVGFDSLSGFFLVKDHYGLWRIRHKSDRRCIDQSIPITAWDTNDLLELNLQHLGWEVLCDTDVESNQFRIHNGSGSGRCGEPSIGIIKERAIRDLARLGLEPII